jgi:hypothetical protein
LKSVRLIALAFPPGSMKLNKIWWRVSIRNPCSKSGKIFLIFYLDPEKRVKMQCQVENVKILFFS